MRLMMILLAALLLAACDNNAVPPKPPVSQVQFSYPVEGKYRQLEEAFPVELAGRSKPYLAEFFWFGCPHCFNFKLWMQQFEATNGDIPVVLIPAVGNPRWEQDARLFYAMEELGLVADYYDPVFNLYGRLGQQKRLPEPEQVAGILAPAGVDAARLREVMGSAAVDQKVKRSEQLAELAGLRGVPALVVNGRYFVQFDGLDQDRAFEDLEKTVRTLALEGK